MRRLKKFLLVLVLPLLVLFPSFSEENSKEENSKEETFLITKTEMDLLQTTLTEQKSLIQKQKTELMTLNTQLVQLNQAMTISNNALMNVSQSLKISEKEELKQKIKLGFTVGCVTLTIGGIAGILCGVFLSK